jgi:hypothetical protein
MRLHVAAGTLLAIFLLVYLPDLGHGFLQDDFGWIAASRADSLGDVTRLFSRNVGFFRPLVAVTFSLDHAIWQLNPFGYGLTNLLLFLLDAVLLFCLARELRLAGDVALFATALWAFNFHSVNMALLWISARTALLMIGFAIAAAMALLRGRMILVGLCSLLAMLCKEEAVMLPAFLSSLVYLKGPRPWFSFLDLTSTRLPSAIRRTWLAWLTLVIYLGLRVNSGAFWIQNAPSYYQFSLDPALLLRNFLEYLDREATVAIGTTLALWLFARRARISLTADEKQTAAFGALWLVCFNALTIFLPIRSDLYALAPSIGAVLIAASVASALRRVTPVGFSTAWTALTVVALLASPVYRLRNERWVVEAELSARVMRTLELATAGVPSGHVTLIDDPSARPNLDDTFGNLLGEAVLLFLGPSWSGAIIASTEAVGARGETASLVLRLRDGQLVEAQAD